jgi:hypothetical protein
MSDPPAPPSASTDPWVVPTPDVGERPTRVRYGVLAFLAAMTFILYTDRASIRPLRSSRKS